MPAPAAALSAYVVNLAGSEARLAAFAAGLAAEHLPFTRVPAIDGRALTPAQAARVDDAACRRYMGRSLQPGEIGCCLSHLAAARAFLDGDAGFGLVFEDDAAPGPGFAETLRAVAGLMDPAAVQVVNLGPSRMKYSRPVADLPGGALHQAFYFPMLATGILYTRPAAEAFLRDCATVTLPHDNRLRTWLTGTPHGFAVLPGIVGQRQDFGSDIERANVGARRGGHRRNRLYFLYKQRRLATEKARALRALLTTPKPRMGGPA